MERKLIKQGGGGFTIYLPKKWVEENKLDKGDGLSLEKSGKNLIISLKPSQKKSMTELKLTNLTESSIRTLITNTYRAGYDNIKIFFNNEKQFKILQKVIKTKLLGFDIINKEKGFLIVENITEPSYDQFDNLLKKLFWNTEEMFEVSRKRLLGDFSVEDFEEIEERIQKYDNFCRRVISKQKLIKEHSEMFWSFLGFILHGQRELYLLNKIINKKLKASKPVIELLDGAYEIFKLLEKSYYEKNIDLLTNIHNLEKQLIYKKVYSLLQSKKANENLVVYHLSVCIRQFYLANSPLCGLII